MEIAINESFRKAAPIVGVVLLIIAIFFVIRSFYGMRIPVREESHKE
jgi:K(+)-stimulated pyrophosphate-energized sodium pump